MSSPGGHVDATKQSYCLGLPAIISQLPILRHVTRVRILETFKADSFFMAIRAQCPYLRLQILVGIAQHWIERMEERPLRSSHVAKRRKWGLG